MPPPAGLKNSFLCTFAKNIAKKIEINIADKTSSKQRKICKKEGLVKTCPTLLVKHEYAPYLQLIIVLVIG